MRFYIDVRVWNRCCCCFTKQKIIKNIRRVVQKSMLRTPWPMAKYHPYWFEFCPQIHQISNSFGSQKHIWNISVLGTQLRSQKIAKMPSKKAQNRVSRNVEIAPGTTLITSSKFLSQRDPFQGSPGAHFDLIREAVGPILSICKLFWPHDKTNFGSIVVHSMWQNTWLCSLTQAHTNTPLPASLTHILIHTHTPTQEAVDVSQCFWYRGWPISFQEFRSQTWVKFCVGLAVNATMGRGNGAAANSTVTRDNDTEPLITPLKAIMKRVADCTINTTMRSGHRVHNWPQQWDEPHPPPAKPSHENRDPGELVDRYLKGG